MKAFWSIDNLFRKGIHEIFPEEVTAHGVTHYGVSFFIGVSVFDTYEDAVKAAEIERICEIECLKRELRNLTFLDFTRGPKGEQPMVDETKENFWVHMEKKRQSQSKAQVAYWVVMAPDSLNWHVVTQKYTEKTARIVGTYNYFAEACGVAGAYSYGGYLTDLPQWIDIGAGYPNALWLWTANKCEEKHE